MTTIIDVSGTGDWLHKPRAYSYIRFSTPDQEKGDSLRRQTAYSEKVAKHLGLTLDNTLRLTDRGISAYKGDHRTKGALGGFLRLVENRQIRPGSVLIIEALDRLSREGMLEAIHLMTGILIKGIDLHTAMDDKHFSKSTYDLADLIISATKLQQGHEESEKKSIRLGEAWKNKRNEAKNGHKLTARCTAWLELSEDRKSFKINGPAAHTINQIFHMKLEGKGSGQIERILNADPNIWLPEPKGNGKKFPGGWRKSYINKILTNRAVIGEFTPHTKMEGKRLPQEPIIDYYPAIVDKNLFNQVQALIQQNRDTKGNAGGRNGPVNNLFGHIARCGNCGGPMAFVQKGKPPKGNSYLVCDRARRGLSCKKAYLRYDAFESLVLTYTKGLDPSEILPDRDNQRSKLATLNNRLQALEGEIAQVQKNINNLLDNLELGEAVKDRLKSRQEEKVSLEAERQELAQQIAKLNSTGQETESQIQSIKELIEGKELNDPNVRLNLRGQLRRLIAQLNVFPDANQIGILFRTWERRLIGKGGIMDILPGAVRVPSGLWKRPWENPLTGKPWNE